MADDHELWERICSRDANAFEAFYRDNAVRLCAYLRRILGTAQAAEDVMQETFTQIWRTPNGFRPELGSLRGYLFGIGRKRAAEWWRKRERIPEEQGEKSGEEAAQAHASFSAVGDAFNRLAEEQRSLLWLREVEGQSGDGERVQLAIKTVYHDPVTVQQEHVGDADYEALEKVQAKEYWIEPDSLINVSVEGLGNMEVSGEFLDHVPITQDPQATLDPDRDEFRIMSPVLIRDNEVLLNLTGMSAIEKVEDAVMLYSPNFGRLILSPTPIQGAIEGRLQANEIGFAIEGRAYLLLTGAPITRSQHVWVLHQPDWRPASRPNPSGSDHRMLAGDKLQRILDWK